jgi:serine/threonine-protein kinase
MLDDLEMVHQRLSEMAESGEMVDEPLPSASEKDTEDKQSDREGHGHAVMIVDSKVAMQDLFRKQLKKYGYRVLVYSDAERALNRFATEKDPPADCVVFCAHSLGEEALVAFNRFGEFARTKTLPALLLLDEKHKAMHNGANVDNHRAVVTMPVPMSEFRETLKQLIQTRYL